MTGINSFMSSYILKDRDVWNQRLEALEHYYLKRIHADEKENNHS